jgi:hypothetical protein
MDSQEQDTLHIAIIGALDDVLPFHIQTQAYRLTTGTGAGIAGLALAIGLHKQGIPFTLYEEAAQYSAVG